MVDMGRAGRSQRKSSRVSDSDDEIFSTSSTGESSDLTLTQEVEEDIDETVMLENHLDALYEKRSSTRESGLNAIIKAFTSSVLLEFALNRYETLLHQYVTLIKRGSPSEASLAAHALGLLAITAGASKIKHQIIEESSPHLARIAKVSSDIACRISAVESLAVITFISETDIEGTEKVMDILWQVGVHKGDKYADQALGITNPPPGVRAAALSSWSFLLTTLPRHQIDCFFVKETLPVLISYLEMDDRAVRITVGEAIAVIFETTGLIYMEENDCPFSSIKEEKDNPPQSSVTVDALKEKVTQQMRILSVEAGGKGSSKKELNNQRSSFRELIAYIEDGTRPETTVKLQNGDVLELKTWSQRTQLNMFRHFLGGGFQKHMQTNSLLHDIFDFTPRQEKKRALSTKEKRMFMSPNSVVSKARTQQLNKRRTISQVSCQRLATMDATVFTLMRVNKSNLFNYIFVSLRWFV